MPIASFLIWSLIVSHTLTINWWGITKIRMSAPFTDSAKSATANWWGERKYDKNINYVATECNREYTWVFMLTTLGGSLWPGRYLTFSWSVLMMSVSLRPFTISSNTHMLTVVSNWSYLAALAPTILAMAEPLRTMEAHNDYSVVKTMVELVSLKKCKCPRFFFFSIISKLFMEISEFHAEV